MKRRLWRWACWGLLVAHFGAVLAIWVTTSFSFLTAGGSTTILALAQMCGLLTAACALLQFMLMGRTPWVEPAFGLENIAKLHRLNGYAVVSFLALHITLVTTAYAGLSNTGLIAQFLTLVLTFDSVWLALIGAILFFTIVFTSVYIVRRHLRYEAWYWVHLMVYAAVILAFFHQTRVGSSFADHPGFVLYWYALYLFVGLNVLIGRFVIPVLNLWRFHFTIDELVHETPHATSIYIRGRGLERFHALPGQFVIIWIPQAKFWLEEHPFSLSALPAGDRLRITVKDSGDYTARLQTELKPGGPIMVCGPYGRFTPEPTARRRLYIAGGVGITPLRAMLGAQSPDTDSTLIYANKTVADTIFAAELQALAGQKHVRIHHVYSAEPNYAGETGHVDAARVARLVPDFRDRDVYLCGPLPMMTSLIASLTAAGLAPSRLHYERFALHPISA